MSVQTVVSAPCLPKAFYFITISRGTRMRTVAFRALFVHALVGFVVLLVLWSLGSTLYLALHDDIVSVLLARQTRMQYAYEDRLSALRGEIDRQASRHLADQAKLDDKMHDLLSREAQLETRAAIVARLASQADPVHDRSPALAQAPSALAPAIPSVARPAFMTDPGRMPSLPADVLGYAGAPAAAPLSKLPAGAAARGVTPLGVIKPHPEAEPLFEPDAPPPKRPGSAALDLSGLPLPMRLSVAAETLDRVEHAQAGALAAIGTRARAQTARLRGLLAEVGLAPERFERGQVAAFGGPFVPAPLPASSAFDRAVADLRASVDAEAQLHDAISHVPLALPLDGSPEVTSPFGTRVDPFLGRLALHTGVDLREDYGASVKTTAAGRVTAAGPAGGYGNMVEVDHGNGLRTRYAHLCEIDVSEGQMLPLGAVVGRVGATGRATGPHLHYEVRIDGEPVDPSRFLAAGLRLADDTVR